MKSGSPQTRSDGARREFLCQRQCGASAKKKRDAFASRFALPEVQVLAMAATAATVRASTTVKASAFVKPTAIVKASFTMEPSITIVLATFVAHVPVRPAVVSTIEAAVSVIATRAPIGALVVVSIVVFTAAPAMPVGTEMMVVVAVKAKRSVVHAEGRIEAPAERAVEDSVSRNEGISGEIRIPIPTGAVPAAHCIVLSPINVGFRGVR